ncbi:vesicle transport protein, putative [Theileria equi strain WA]|uniref:Vesicle transport protein, putative n=1 Tax=Theileria equi strain WA TaxID=1537102 RepID=L0AUB6_THEEQ|nr:vesicle transport protein, putative [Theileria equi strain WA]AFZ79150.1 vesicle transport protein, putative [Theileria equi strain WA]|eukprot:XP_004828816.1 vesicle transport protein, putative [Theileria equi strain WA]
MGDMVVICRSSDGLPLVEVWDEGYANASLNEKISKNDLQTIKMNARIICRKLPVNESKCSILEANMSYHYIIEDGICYMSITQSSFPKKQVFVFLAELCQAFTTEIKKQPGVSSQSISAYIANVEKPYYFMAFDRTIYKLRSTLSDPKSNKSLNMINSSLTEVTNIMKKNIDEILNRGENLEDIGRMADGLRTQTQKFKLSSRKLNRDYLLRKYSSISVGIFFIFVLLYVYFKRGALTK